MNTLLKNNTQLRKDTCKLLKQCKRLLIKIPYVKVMPDRHKFKLRAGLGDSQFLLESSVRLLRIYGRLIRLLKPGKLNSKKHYVYLLCLNEFRVIKGEVTELLNGNFFNNPRYKDYKVEDILIKTLVSIYTGEK